MTDPESPRSRTLDRIHELVPEAFRQTRGEVLAKLALHQLGDGPFPQVVDPSVLQPGDVLRSVDAFDGIVRGTHKIFGVELVNTNKPRCRIRFIRIGDDPEGKPADRYAVEPPSPEEYFAARQVPEHITKVRDSASIGLVALNADPNPRNFFTYSPAFLIATAEDYNESLIESDPGKTEAVDTSWQTWAFEC